MAANDNKQPRLPQMEQQAHLLGGGAGQDTPYVQDPLLKSLRKPQMPSGIPHRHIPGANRMAGYKGLADPRKSTQISFDVLEMMGRAHIVRAIIQHLVRAATRYARRPRRRGDYGFRIELADPEKEMTAADRAEAEALTQFLLRGGYDYLRTTDGQIARWDGRAEEHALRFDQLLGLIVEDSLLYDAAAIRMEAPEEPQLHPIYQEFPEAREHGSPHPPVWFGPVPGKRVRKAATVYHDEEKTVERAGGRLQPAANASEYTAEIREELGQHVAWVELGQDGNVAREYTANELAYFVRNIKSDTWTVGYGRSELEYLVEVVTGLASGVSYNVEYFTQNHVPDGILALSGEWGEERLKQFQADIVTQVGGPGKYHKLPLLFSDSPEAKAAFVGTKDASRLDMYWEKWISWVITAICSLYGLAPEAIWFQSFRGASNSLQEADPSTRILHGEDSGFVPIMLALESFVTERLVWPIDSRFRFVFTNLRERDEAAQWGLTERKLSSGVYTVNRALTEMGEPEIKDPMDKELWSLIERRVERQWPATKSDKPARERTTEQVYEHFGGEFASWPDAPGPVVPQVYMQEFGQQMAGGEEDMDPMAMMGMGPDAVGPGGDPGPGGFDDEGSPDAAGMSLGGDDPAGPADEDLLSQFLPPGMEKSVPSKPAGKNQRPPEGLEDVLKGLGWAATMEGAGDAAGGAGADMEKSVPPGMTTQRVDTDDLAAQRTRRGVLGRVLARLDAWRGAVARRLAMGD